MIKMKNHANARNGKTDLSNPNVVQNLSYGAQPLSRHNFQDETDLKQFAGSFDNREKVKEIQQRNIANQIPASKITFKKGSKEQTLRANGPMMPNTDNG